MKKSIGLSLCTLFWHVDDLKTSRIQSVVVDDVLRRLEVKYVKVAPLKTTQGKVGGGGGGLLHENF